MQEPAARGLLVAYSGEQDEGLLRQLCETCDTPMTLCAHSLPKVVYVPICIPMCVSICVSLYVCPFLCVSLYVCPYLCVSYVDMIYVWNARTRQLCETCDMLCVHSLRTVTYVLTHVPVCVPVYTYHM